MVSWFYSYYTASRTSHEGRGWKLDERESVDARLQVAPRMRGVD